MQDNPAQPVTPIQMPPYEYQKPVLGAGQTTDASAIEAAKRMGRKTGTAINPPAPAAIDPMEAFAETPRMLPTFSTRHGLRMSYVDSAGKQRCLNLKTADLTRIINSAAVALEIVTREQTMANDIPASKA